MFGESPSMSVSSMRAIVSDQSAAGAHAEIGGWEMAGFAGSASLRAPCHDEGFLEHFLTWTGQSSVDTHEPLCA